MSDLVPAARRINAQVVEAAGRWWVAGLVWHNFESRPGQFELRATAQEERSESGEPADWVAVRVPPRMRQGTRVISGATQAGFCQPIPGEAARPRGLYSLGAAIAGIEAEPWLGLFDLGNGLWWCIAVRDNQTILPTGDVIGRKEVVMAAHHELLAYPGWTLVEGTITDLTKVLGNKSITREPTRLKSLTPLPPAQVLKLVAWPAAGVAFVVAVVSLWNWHVHALEIARERALAAAGVRTAPKLSPSPLGETPPPDVWLSACGAVINSTVLSLDGWSLSGIACGAHAVDLTWSRLPTATTLARPPGRLSADGNVVLQTIRLPALGAGVDSTQSLSSAASLLFGILQPLKIQADIVPPALPPALPGATRQPVPSAVPEMTLHFISPVPPWALRFDNVPGLRLTMITQTPSGWLVEGALYGR